MLCGIDNISWNISHIQTIYEQYLVEYCQTHKFIVMDMNNVIKVQHSRVGFACYIMTQ